MKELSKKNPYKISKNRQWELIFFCLQYSEWEEAIKEINYHLKGEDPTGDTAVRLAVLEKKKKMVRTCCALAGDINDILFTGVTERINYETLEARYGTLPWARSAYYRLYRRFMYILSSQDFLTL